MVSCSIVTSICPYSGPEFGIVVLSVIELPLVAVTVAVFTTVALDMAAAVAVVILVAPAAH